MHVLIVPSWYPQNPADLNGCFFREQALALHKHGCKVGVIAPMLRSLRAWKSIFSGPYGINFENDAGLVTYRNHGINWLVRIQHLQAKIFVNSGLRLFEEYIKDNGKPNIIHAHSLLYGGMLARRIKERYGIPYIVTEHSSLFLRQLVQPKTMLAAQHAAMSASRLLAVSTPFANLLNQYFKNTNWDALPNIVSEHFFQASALPKDNEFTFINVAHTNKNKSQNLLIKAFAKLSREIPSAALRIVGSGPELVALQNLSITLGLNEKIEFLGALAREDVRLAMSKAHAFVLSSQHETFGVVLIEALAQGLPLIATRCGGPEDIINKDNGLLVPINDVDRLAEAMFSIYNNYEKYDPEKLLELCKEEYSEKSISLKLIEIYQETLRSKATGEN